VTGDHALIWIFTLPFPCPPASQMCCRHTRLVFCYVICGFIRANVVPTRAPRDRAQNHICECRLVSDSQARQRRCILTTATPLSTSRRRLLQHVKQSLSTDLPLCLRGRLLWYITIYWLPHTALLHARQVALRAEANPSDLISSGGSLARGGLGHLTMNGS
jgi:hypothetical protein